MAQPPLLLYDGDCPLCRSLAALVARRTAGAVAVRAWQEVQQATDPKLLSDDQRQRPADRLRILDGANLLEGEDAWAYLLANYRDMAGLNWLAASTGLTQPLARGAAAAGHLVRRLCRRCPRPDR